MHRELCEDPDDGAAAWATVSRELDAFPEWLRDAPVSEASSAGAVRTAIEGSFSFERPRDLRVLVEELIPLMRRGMVHVTHPRYFGLYNPSVRGAGVIADTLAALYNPQLAAWSHAPFWNELEQWTLRELGRQLGWPPGFRANFTSGGCEANHSAVLAALAWAAPDWSRSGFRAFAREPAVYGTSETHHSLVRVLRWCGLGAAAFRAVPLDSRLRMDATAFEEQVQEDLALGFRPLLVAATAGSTSAGIVDPLEPLADVARRHGIWFHVDAAWGATARLSPVTRPLLEGLSQADSVTWDAHKWLHAPMGAGMFFCRRPQAVTAAFGQEASYMPGKNDDDALDPYSSTMQWTRRAIGFKVFLTLAELGWDGVARLVDRQVALADRLRARLQEEGFELVNETPLPVVCYTRPPAPRSLDRVLARLQDDGRVWVSQVTLPDRPPALRACITSFRTTDDDLEILVDASARAFEGI